MMENILINDFIIGDLKLANRIVMAPLTRCRAWQNGVPTDIMAQYYGQRATAGLIISESVMVSEEGFGYPYTPGIYNEEQVTGWSKVTQKVKSQGGKIFAQLQHCGRISHPDFQPNGAKPLAPSPIKPEGTLYTYSGKKEYVVPKPLEVGQIETIIEQFRQSAIMAREAGFDGVEVHGANGYLIDQFLRDGTNKREDSYGGNPQNRMRFLNEILDSICNVWPSGRVGVRFSPENSFNSMSDSDPQNHFEYFLSCLNGRDLSYVHILEGDMKEGVRQVDYRELRETYKGVYMANNGYDFKKGNGAIQSNDADLISYGALFIANPDLVSRFSLDLPLKEADQSTYYTGGELGYIDYPSYQAV